MDVSNTQYRSPIKGQRTEDKGQGALRFRDHLLGLLLAALFFAVAAPTLYWSEFSSGSENLNVATALEIRRTDHWLLPTLQGQPRIAKPPLTAWLTAASIRPATFQALSSPDPATRDAAFHTLGWEVRWAAVLCACLMLLATYELALLLVGQPAAIFSAIICGTCYTFIRFSRISATDNHLALWVAIANYFLTLALLQGKCWRGYLAAGLAVGLAFMSKGPVALVQTLAPFAAFIAWHSFARHKDAQLPSLPGLHRSAPWPMLLGLLLALAVALPWFILVIAKYDVWNRWYNELFTGDRLESTSKFYAYICFFPMMLPWLVFLIIAMLIAGVWTIDGLRARLPKHSSLDPVRLVLVLFLTVIPIIIMSFFSERKERYLFPMVGPAAILVAHGLIVCLRSNELIPDKLRPLFLNLHWAILFAASVVFPVVGALPWVDDLRRADGRPWFSGGLAAAAAITSLIILTLALRISRRRPTALAYASLILMLLVQVLALHGYRYTDVSETLPLATTIWSHHPTAPVYSYRPGQPGRRAPEELSIYLNRSVYPIDNPELIPPADQDQVLLAYQREGSPMPQIPPGWTFFTRFDRGKDRWYAYARLPQKDQ
ncbi:MAG: glycosyltransferase family 39 protein [Bacillota bacterium]